MKRSGVVYECFTHLIVAWLMLSCAVVVAEDTVAEKVLPIEKQNNTATNRLKLFRDPVQADPVQADPVQADPVQADTGDKASSAESRKKITHPSKVDDSGLLNTAAGLSYRYDGFISSAAGKIYLVNGQALALYKELSFVSVQDNGSILSIETASGAVLSILIGQSAVDATP